MCLHENFVILVGDPRPRNVKKTTHQIVNGLGHNNLEILDKTQIPTFLPIKYIES